MSISKKRIPALSFPADDAESDLISEAAKAAGKTVKEFMRAAVLNAACSALEDQADFTLSAAQTAAVLEILGNPPPPNANLQGLMKTPASLVSSITSP